LEIFTIGGNVNKHAPSLYRMQNEFDELIPVLYGVDGSDMRVINHGLAETNPYRNKRGQK